MISPRISFTTEYGRRNRRRTWPRFSSNQPKLAAREMYSVALGLGRCFTELTRSASMRRKFIFLLTAILPLASQDANLTGGKPCWSARERSALRSDQSRPPKALFPWTVIDQDILLPHNLARPCASHSGHGRAKGICPATADGSAARTRHAPPRVAT